MVVIQPWAAWISGGVVLVAVILAVLLALSVARRRSRDAVPVAHVERLTALPGYRRALGRYRAWLVIVAIVALLGVAASTALTMRFATAHVVSTDDADRDIVLCLDVSGSMVDYDDRVVDVFAELARRFDGERLSLVVFNASAVTYFPLTSDLDYIERQFDTLRTQFASADQSYFDGTLVGDGSSLVGDGLASCVLRFDNRAQQRSRSIVLVTDNVVIGTPVYTLPQAGALSRERGIRVYGINPGDTNSKDYLQSTADEFETTVRETGGTYFSLGDPDAVPTIVAQITSEQVALTKGPSRIVVHDSPALATALAALALALLVLVAWRVRR